MVRKGIVQIAQELRDRLTEKYKSVDFISATSDIWSKSNQSYIAVSVHYFEKDDTLSTDFIACESFEGAHTNDRIAEKLSNIFDRFGILHKVSFITTDGDSKYVAALKNYGDHYETMTDYLSYDEEWFGDAYGSDVLPNTDEDLEHDDDDDETNERYNLIRLDPEDNDFVDSDHESDSDSHSGDDLRTLLAAASSEPDNCFVVEKLQMSTEDISSENPLKRVLGSMNRIACSSHALDKVGSKDAQLARKDIHYKRIHDSTMKKLQSLWKCKKSRQKAEKFKAICGKKLIGPHRIRWMSKFDQVT